MTLPQGRRIKVLHISTGLGTGGAEMMLYKLVKGMDPTRFQNEVVSLVDLGTIGERIRELGIPVAWLGMEHSIIGRAIPNPLALVRLTALIKRSAPDIIQTWMYHANLVGLIGAMINRVPAVSWSVHGANLDLHTLPRTTAAIFRLLVRLSSLPAAVVTVSHAARSWHEAMGYRARNWVYIPIGFDLDQFRPDASCKDALRRELGVAPETLLIGNVGRFHEHKDQANFIRAMALVIAEFPMHAVMVGSGVDGENQKLTELIRLFQIQDHFHLLGERHDILRIMAGLDILCSSSSSEAAPNVLGEAMACEVPCVVTDVGDCASIVGDTGKVAPPHDPQALAAQCCQLLAMDQSARARLGSAGRRRVAQQFSLDTVVRRYEDLYDELAHHILRPASDSRRTHDNSQSRVQDSQ